MALESVTVQINASEASSLWHCIDEACRVSPATGMLHEANAWLDMVRGKFRTIKEERARAAVATWRARGYAGRRRGAWPVKVS